MRKKYRLFDQLEVFRPMPVPDALKRQIRQEADRAKAMAASIQKKPMELPIGSKQ